MVVWLMVIRLMVVWLTGVRLMRIGRRPLETEPKVFHYIADGDRDLGTWEDLRFDQSVDGDQQQGYIERNEKVYIDLVGIHKQGPHRKGIRPRAADEEGKQGFGGGGDDRDL